jgi:very-short-patch-repair endonuclease
MPHSQKTTDSCSDDTRRKAVGLFSYLREIAKLRLSTVRDCRDYEEVLWFDDIPKEPECESIANSDSPDGNEPWLRIERAGEPPCPEPPHICSAWVNPAILRNNSEAPRLRDEIAVQNANPDESPTVHSLHDHPEVQRAWESFLREKWETWGQNHRRWEAIQRVYDHLFSIHQTLKKSSETFELVLGLGLLNWQMENGTRVFRHLLVGQASLQFDPHRGVLTVAPGSDGIRLSLEQDMLEANERPLNELQEACKREVEAVAEMPWPSSAVESPLQSYAHALNRRGSYDSSLESPTTLPPVPVVTFAPAIILRKRTARSLVKLLDDISSQLATGGDVPFGVRRLCEIIGEGGGDEDDKTDDEAEGIGQADNEVYFPLPANDEQFRIVRRLAGSQGVLVQGPPGTGKSHTIANLICHLLATGQRVLVTSQTPRALKVLEAKVPTELSALCVSVLGNDAGALKNLQNSVHGITDKQQTWMPEQNRQAIDKLARQLAENRKSVSGLENSIREHREAETWQHRIAWGAYAGTASEIAQRVTAEAAHFDWLTDVIREETPVPFSASVFAALLEAWRRLSPERRAEVKRPIPSADVVLDVSAFLSAVDEEHEARAVVESLARREDSPRCKRLQAADASATSALVAAVQAFQKSVAALEQFRMPWIKQAVTGILTGHERTWLELFDLTTNALDGLIERARHAQAREVTLPDGSNSKGVLADARELHAHIASGRGLGFLIFRAEVVRRTLYVTRAVCVNGRPAARADVLVELIEHLETQLRVDELRLHWVDVHEVAGGTIVRQVNELQTMRDALGAALALRDELAAARSAVTVINGMIEPSWDQPWELDALLSDCEAGFARQRLATITAQLTNCNQALESFAVRPQAHPVSEKLSTSFNARDPRAYANAHEEWTALTADAELLATLEERHAAVAASAAMFAHSLADAHADARWDSRLVEVEAAWQWARARTWLQDFLSRGDPASLEDELARLQKQQRETMAKLAASKAWGHCFARLTPSQREHLNAWMLAMKRIGRGKTDTAERHRRDAQAHLEACRDAVPAWVMPFHRIAETITANPEAFDVIIIDEASQSGPETLALLYLGKQIVVVGDDEQISPEGVGVSRNAVDALADQFLAGIPHRDALGITSSLFHQAAIRFSGRVVLREHFRCMPEIIRFSSDLCYRGQLEPLRQYPPQRLEPIVVRQVADGYREGTAQSAKNPVEADALVEAICECCRKPAYAGKTIGVISLQGEAQAKFINSLLVKRLTPEEIEEREIVCGDAYAFQGDERDIMFLSMVAAPNARFQALTTDSARQRFNVAASRARDQVWLFHSLTLNDMNPSDMRYKLLAYYSDPRQQPTGGPDWEKCESKFERAVGQIIHDRHYRLVPQFEPFGPNGKRIDFVIEGSRTRLAVECDGPHHEEPEQIVQDLARQRQLERCGWTFWRVSAAAFYANTDAALASLWKKLANMGIDPIGASSSATPPNTGESVPSSASTEASPKERQQPAIVVQTDFLPKRQADLFVQSKPSISLEIPPESANTEIEEDTLHDIIEALRSKHSSFLGDDMRRVILAAIPRREKIPIRDVVRRVVGALNQEGAAYSNRVNEIVEKMIEERVLIGNLTQVWRTPKD